MRYSLKERVSGSGMTLFIKIIDMFTGKKVYDDSVQNYKNKPLPTLNMRLDAEKVLNNLNRNHDDT